MMQKIIDILNTQDIIRVAPEDTLSSALSKLSSSHDAAFVFNDEDEFMGVINPYHSLIKNSYPGNAKVEHCLFHPPKIYLKYPLYKAMKLFIESKIHYLPVFNEKNVFQGIISARKLLEVFDNHPSLKMSVGSLINKKTRPSITINEDDTISTALHLFKQYKVSKLIVINKNQKLRGVLSYYDLIFYLITPREKEHLGEREGNKNSFYNQRVKRFAKTYVLTLTLQDSAKQAVDMILEKHIGSVVIVDAEKRPIGIITTRDMFGLMLKPENSLQLQLSPKNLSKQSNEVVRSFFRQFTHLLRKVPNLTRANLLVKEEKSGGVFKVLLSLLPAKGHKEVIQREGKNLEELLNEVKQGVKSKRSKI